MSKDKTDSGFWSGWIPKAIALAAIGWGARRPIASSLQTANAAMRNGLGHLGEAASITASWLKRQALRIFFLTLFVSGVTMLLTFIGLTEKSRALVVTGGLTWVTYLIFLWVLIKASVKTVAALVEKGTDISASAITAVLKKVGLAEGNGDALRVKLDKIDAVLSKGFVLLPGFSEAFFLLALMPSFSTLLLIAVVGIGVISSGLISAQIGDTMVDGWRLIKRINFILFSVLGVVAVVAFFLPQTFATYANPGALDAWLVDPSGASWFSGVFSSFWGTVLGILAIGAVAWTVAGLIKGEIGERLTFVILGATVIGMTVGGYRAWGSDSKSSEVDHVVIIGDNGEKRITVDMRQRGRQVDIDIDVDRYGASGMPMPEEDYQSGGSATSRGSAKPVETPPHVPSEDKPDFDHIEDGYDRAEARLAEVGL